MCKCENVQKHASVQMCKNVQVYKIGLNLQKCVYMSRCAKLCASIKSVQVCKSVQIGLNSWIVEQWHSLCTAGTVEQLSSWQLLMWFWEEKNICAQLGLKNSNEKVVPYLNALCVG